MSIGSRVMRAGWTQHPDWQHLARLGTVTHVASPQLVEVRWDAGETAPPRDALERIDDLTHLWWRST